MRRFLASSLVALTMTVTSAYAADGEGQVIAPAVTAAAALAATPEMAAAIAFPTRTDSNRRPLMLPALYVTTAALQGYDAYSTLAVLKHGGVEANPLMKGITKSPTALVALKVGMVAASIMAAERMWKNGNRVGAVATMLVSNGFMAYVAHHNRGVLNQVR